VRRKSEPLSAELVLASRECALDRTRALRYTAALHGVLLWNLRESVRVHFLFTFSFSSFT